MIIEGDPEKFLTDFYSKKNNEEISQEKLDSILSTYGDNYDMLISDLYSKYDSEGLDDSKLATIKEAYKLSPEKDLEQKYLVNGIEVDKAGMTKRLYDDEFVERFQKGEITVDIENDSRLKAIANQQKNSGDYPSDAYESIQIGFNQTLQGILAAETYVEDAINLMGFEDFKFNKIIDREARNELSKQVIKKAEELETKIRATEGDFLNEVVYKGNYSRGAKMGLNTVLQSGPIMLASMGAAALTGGSSAIVQALAGAGTMTALLTPAEYVQTLVSEDPNIQKLSKGEKFFRGTARGLAEGIPEGIMGPVGLRGGKILLQGLKGLVKKTSVEAGETAAKGLAKELGKETSLEIAQAFGLGTAAEGVTELTTSLAQDLTDDFLGVHNLGFEKYMRRGLNSGALGIFMGGVVQGTGITLNSGKNTLLRNNSVKQGAISQIRKEQELGNISKQQGDELIKQIDELQKAVDQTDSDLSNDQQEKIANLIYEKNQLNQRTKGLDPNQESVKKAKERILEIDSEISSVSESDVDIASKRVEVEEGIQELKLNKTIKFLETQGKKLGKKTYTVEDEFDTDGNLVKSADEKAQEIYDEYVKENPGTKPMDVSGGDGFKIGNIAVINKTLAKQTGAISVGSHETFHFLVDDYFEGIDIKDRRKLIKDFKNLLSKKQLNVVNKRIQDAYMGIEGFDPETSIEWFTGFSDAIELNEITFDESIGNKILNFVHEILRKVLPGFNKEFSNARQAYNFMKDYSKSVSKGEVGKRALKLSETPTVKKDISFSKTKENKEIKEIFDKFTGPAENRKFKSKEEFTGIPILNKKGNIISYEKDPSPEFFDALLEIEQSNTLDASIRNTVSESYLDMNPGFVKEVKEKISDKFKSEYDASKNSLFGWLTGKNISGQPLINRASGDIQIKRGKKPSTVSADKKIGGEDAKTTVAETLVSDDISPEDYTDMKLVQDKLKKIKPQQSKIAKKIDLTDNEINLAKRDIINFLRKTDRPAMTDAKKFFKALIDYTTGKGVQPGGFANVIYDKLSLPKNGELSTKNRESFIKKIAEDLIALNKVDPSVMRRSKWNPFYELEIKNMNPTQMQKAIDEGRIPSTSNLKSGLDLFKTLDPSVDQVVDYLMGIRPDVLKRKIPKFLAEVVVKNEFNEIVENTNQPVYDAKGNKTDNTIDLSENISEEEVTRGAPQVREKIARPQGFKFSKSVDEIINIRNLFQLETNGKDKLLKAYGLKESLKIKSSKDIPAYIDMLKKDVFSLLPKEAFFGPGKGTAFTSSSAIFGLESLKDPKTGKSIKVKDESGKFKSVPNPLWVEIQTAIQELKNDNSIVYGDPIPNVNSNEIWALRNKYDKLFKSPEIIEKNIKNGEIKKFNKQIAAIHKTLWERINKEVSKDKNKATGIATYLGIVANDTGHWHKLGAQFEGYSKNITGKRYEYEHAMPATAAYLYLLDATLSSVNFNTAYNLVIDNYKLIALDKAMDDKLRNARTAEGYSLQRRMPDNWSVIDNFWWQRYFNDIVYSQDGGIDPSSIIGLNGKTFSEIFSVDAGGNSTTVEVENSKAKAKNINVKNLSNNVVNFSKSLTNENVISYAATVDEALNVARNPNAPIKKIRVFDFDDTLATTKSDVLFTAPDGTEGKLNAEEFAKEGSRLLEEGYVFDFSEFNKVTKGKPGPLLNIAKKIQAARGTEDVFVLTARAPEAQIAIKEFLDSVGLNIPLENITGLGNSTGAAKAKWMVEKAADGYNDFYFADDAYQNVKAVKDAMSVIDVKSKVQQAKIKFSKSVNEDFNKIIEQTTGIASEKRYSEAKAKVRGANKGNKKFFIPYSAEDFMGLIYPLLSKGKLGDSQMAWFKEHLLNPYGIAMENLSTDRLQLMEDFKALKKALDVPKDLRKKTDSGFTKEQAVRVYLFNKAGYEVPGISKTDLNELIELVDSDPKLKTFGDQIFNLTKGDGYAKPGDSWLVGTITTDLIDVLNTVKRAKYLEESGYNANVELVFSKENLNKLEAAYGSKYREAMENILGRMKSGKNRIFSGNRLSNRVLDYINGSTGAIMFFNTRSAILQTISAVNFLNWSFNNPIKAGAAFANQPQYWKDFMKLMNSDYLMDRRNGLKLNISESEIADAAATSKNKAKSALNYILQKGFLPTQFADSFAIASGGATFYRNRIKDLVKQGKTEADAKKQALIEFRQIAEESQQSSDPSRISSQQASNAGRIILAFGNTPMQYARIQKRAIQDLINGRGDAKANISKVIYYGFAQNIIFNVLQQAVFSLGFGDDEDEMNEEQLKAKEINKNKKYFNVVNGMLDSLLRGLGIGGAAVSVGKNFLIDIYERSGRDRPEYVDSIWEVTRFSPPIYSKLSKLKQAAWQFDSKKRREKIFTKGFALDNPAYEAASKVVSATTNVPLDRVLYKFKNIEGALNEDNEIWQRIAMLGGWPEWQLKDPKVITPLTDEEKTKAKENKKQNLYKEAKGSTDYDTLKKLTSSQQIKMLKGLGFGEYTIKNAKSEDAKIKLIQAKNSGKEIKVDKQAIKKAKFKKLSKADQVRKLDSLGLSKDEIKALEYENDRVEKLIELMEK